jgi:predicted amidophosphoribosyltransferase
MEQGSYCSQCGFKTDNIMLACPRCRQPLQHQQCKQCGRCPQPRDKNKE